MRVNHYWNGPVRVVWESMPKSAIESEWKSQTRLDAAAAEKRMAHAATEKVRGAE